jgi:plastocyanin
VEPTPGLEPGIPALFASGQQMHETPSGAEKGGPLRSLFRIGGIAAALATLSLSIPLSATAEPSEIYASDACSPSFNVALQDPTICSRNGGTPFDTFIQELTLNKFAGAWHFSAPRVNIDRGDSLTVENRGGETHTLTQVTQFGGGGIVPPINEILFGTPAPPTFFFGPFNFIPAGGETTIPSSVLTPGTHLFFCAIHPWMHETVVVH